MSRTRLFAIVAVVMLLLNIGLMYIVFTGRQHAPPPDHRMPPHHAPGERPRMIIIDRLEFDPTQVAAYDELISRHRGAIDSQERVIRSLKRELYATLQQGTEKPDVQDSVIAELGAAQQHVERIHYRHFEEIRMLCRPEQLPLFNELSAELAAIFSGPPGKRR